MIDAAVKREKKKVCDEKKKNMHKLSVPGL